MACCVRDLLLCACVLFMIVTYRQCSSALSQQCLQGSSCRLPQCYCPNSTIPPMNLTVEETPQIVVFAFDGSVNKASYVYYKTFFKKSLKNSNGCPIRATLFTKNQYTNHTLVKDLYRHGFEIAGNSVTGKLPISFWRKATRDDMLAEILNNKKQLSEKAGIPATEIRGWRSPHNQPTGDIQFKILEDNGYEYDSSLYMQRRSLNSPLSWPGTLQFKWPFSCEIDPCPSKNYTLWEIPVVALLDHKQQYPCMSVGGCINKPEEESHAFQLLWRNFFNFYRNDKTPFIVNLKPGWLNTDYHYTAMERFILSLLDMNDVYVVTMHQMIQWMQNPTSLDSILEFEPWKCPHVDGSPAPSVNISNYLLILWFVTLFMTVG